MASKSHMLQLADTITTAVIRIQEILEAKNLPLPSFEENSSFNLPREAADAQDSIFDATTELCDLLMEPMHLIHGHGAHNNPLCQRFISQFGIAAMIPSGGRLSFADIAKQTPFTETMVMRILRHAMTMRIFYEPELGFVAHTKASKALADPIINDWLRAGTEEMWPASTKVLDALEKWPASQEPNETGFCIEKGITNSIYDYLGAHPERAGRFRNATVAYSRKAEHDPLYITEYFDWKSLGRARVVQIGGGSGAYAIALAKAHSNLELVVQDMASRMGPAEAGVPEELKGKVVFEQHELFTPQTNAADVFYYRWNLRYWSDKYVALALNALLSVLRPGNRVIIQDIIMPEPGAVPLWKEKISRTRDLNLAASFNSRDRTVAEWTMLLKNTNSSFVLKQVTEPVGSALGILEVRWENDI